MILLIGLFTPFRYTLLFLLICVCSYIVTPEKIQDRPIEGQTGHVAGFIVSIISGLIFIIFCIICIFYYIKF